MFSNDETVLLQGLVEKHFYCLDTSLTRDSLDLRNKAWDIITEEFNKAQVNGIQRDMSELKIKHKNMRAQRFNFKSEGDTSNSTVNQTYVEIDPMPEENLSRSLRSKAPESSATHKSNDERPRAQRYEAILDGLDSEDYSDDDDDVSEDN